MYVGKVGHTTMLTPKQTTIDLPFVQPKDERIGWFYTLIRRIMVGKLAKGMEQVYIHNLKTSRELTTKKGAIIAPNHTSYWDSCLFFLLSHMLGNRSFVFVAKLTLERLPFLRWCGSIPLDTNSKGIALQQLIATKHLTSEPTQFWIFPQGEHRPINQPLEFQKGVTVLAQSLVLPIVPVAIQYLYKDDEKPIAYVSFGNPLPFDASLDDIEQSVQHGLDDIQAFHMGRKAYDFIPLFQCSSKKQDDLATRILAWFSGKILGAP